LEKDNNARLKRWGRGNLLPGAKPQSKKKGSFLKRERGGPTTTVNRGGYDLNLGTTLPPEEGEKDHLFQDKDKAKP